MMTGEAPGNCLHCGRRLTEDAGYARVKGANVCHPRIPDGPDCYRLVTVYREHLGSRTPKFDETTGERLKAIEERERKATDGPWYREDDQQTLTRMVLSRNGELDINFGYLGNRTQNDVDFVVYARQDIPWLVGRLRQALRENETPRSAPLEELRAKLDEMTRLRDNAVRQLNREDDTAPFELEELIHEGIDAVIGDWEGDVPLERVVTSIAKALHPDVVKLTEYQDRAEAKIRELAKERLDLLDQISINKKHYQRRTETLEAARDRSKQQLDDVVNEVFTITDAYDLPEDRDEAGNAHLYGLGRSAGLKDAYFAVLRGLGVFDPNHNPYVLVARLEDLRLLRLAINDPGAYTEREEIHEGEYESVANWAARAVQIALREGRGDR